MEVPFKKQLVPTVHPLTRWFRLGSDQWSVTAKCTYVFYFLLLEHSWKNSKGCCIPTDQWEHSIPRYTSVLFPLRIFHFFYLLQFIVLQFLVWPFQIVTVWTVGVCIGKYYSTWSINASWLAKLHVLCFSHSRTFKNPEFSLVLL